MDASNILHLIEEVKKRPALWDVHHPDHRDRTNVPHMWEQIAETIEIRDVEQVKRKWKNLRDAFRAEVRRTQRRAEKYKHLQKKDPRSRGTSKWAYFVPMSFIVNAKPADRPASRSPANSGASAGSAGSNENTRLSPLAELADVGAGSDVADTATTTTATNDAVLAIASLNETSQDSVSYIPDTAIKEEPIHCFSTDDENAGDMNDEDMMQRRNDEDMDEVNNEMLFEEFQSLATPQAMRRLSHRISMEQAAAEDAHNAAQFVNATTSQNCSSNNYSNTLTFAPAAAAAPSTTTAATSSSATAPPPPSNTQCKCSQRVDEQVNFLQNLEREEEKLMQSTRQDISRCQSMLHVGDSDYNFLISFLPLMKKMNDIQNINFRAKMSELLVHTLGMNQTPAQASNMNQMYANFNPTMGTTTANTLQPQQQPQQQQQQQLFMLQQLPQSTTSSGTSSIQTQSSDSTLKNSDNTPQVSTSSNQWN